MALPANFKDQAQFDAYYAKQSTADQAKLTAAGYSATPINTNTPSVSNYIAANNKSYDITTNNDGTASFVSQWNIWADGKPIVKSFASYDLAKWEIDKYNKAPTETNNNNNIETTSVDSVTPTDTTQEKVKTDTKTQEQAYDYQSNDPVRLEAVQQWLATHTTTNPQLLNNRAQFDQYFHYTDRWQAQKDVLDSFFNAKKDEAVKLKADQDRFNVLNNMSENDLMLINTTSDLALIQTDPNLTAKYQQAQKNKQITEFVYWPKKDTSNIIDWLDNIAWNLSSEISTAKSEYLASKDELDTLQTDIDNTYNRLVKESEWTGATDSYLRAKANKINAELMATYNIKVKASNLLLSRYSTLAEEYKTKQADIQAEEQRASQRMQLYTMMYGSFSERNQWVDAAKTWTNTITGEWFQRNPTTWTYDIPLWGSWQTNTTSSSQTSIQPPTTWMRTDRNNNPTAMTIDVAKQWWLVEWVDYVKWDAFTWANWKTYYTAKMLWDTNAWIQSAIKVIDSIWFKTQAWKNRWTYTDKIWLNNESWAKMSNAEKIAAVKKMYKNEWGSWVLFDGVWETSETPNNTSQSFTELQKKSMDSFVLSKQTPQDEYNLLTKNWLDRNKLETYLATSALQSSDFWEALNSLSAQAQAVIKWGKLPVGKDSTKVLDEIAKSWVANFWMWNTVYWTLKPEDRASLADLKNLQERINIMTQLDPKIKTWWTKQAKEWFKWKAESLFPWIKTSADYNALKMATWKNLTAFMKEISGVAISAQEMARLQEYMPNVSMSDSKFANALSAYKREFENILKWKLTTYGFDNLDNLSAALKLWNVKSWQELTNNNNSYNNIYDYAWNIDSQISWAVNMVNAQ